MNLDKPVNTLKADHPYYGPEQSYYANGYQARDDNPVFETWEDFVTDYGADDLDLDYNLVYRWDWKWAQLSDYYFSDDEDAAEDNAEEQERWDEESRKDTLHLYIMQQRRGKMVHISIRVTDADEPVVREWLRIRAEHMVRLWKPLLDK